MSAGTHTYVVPETLDAGQREALSTVLNKILGNLHFAYGVTNSLNYTEADQIIDLLRAFNAPEDSLVIEAWLEGDAEEREIALEDEEADA